MKISLIKLLGIEPDEVLIRSASVGDFRVGDKWVSWIKYPNSIQVNDHIKGCTYALPRHRQRKVDFNTKEVMKLIKSKGHYKNFIIDDKTNQIFIYYSKGCGLLNYKTMELKYYEY